jgi:D-3-phosphoglycerate dehydrogenase
MARVLVSEALEAEGLEYLRQRHEVDYQPGCRAEELHRHLAEADALIVRSGTKVNAAAIAAAPKLRVIGRAGVGYDNIDLETATARGILVVNVPEGNTIAACEQTMALMLALARHVPQAASSLREGRWERGRFVGSELRGKTLGLVGLGRVGQEVARRARAFEMTVVAFDPFVDEATAESCGAVLGTLDEVLDRADVLSLHTPLTPQTEGLIGTRALARMRQGSLVVNCARGGVVDEDALLEALKSGHIGGAALDVFRTEPPTGSELLALPNVVATPHLGASTREAQSATAALVAEYVCRALAGEAVGSAVNLPRLLDSDWTRLRPLVPLAEAAGRLHVQAIGSLGSVEAVLGGGEWPPAAGELLLRSCLAGLLSGVVGEEVNLVSAPALAKQRGLQTAWSVDADGDPRSLQLRVGGRSVTVALGGAGEARLTNLDGMAVDVALTSDMLIFRHRDRPGMLGQIGTLLGSRGINVAGAQVGRKQVRGDAVLVMAVDDPVPVPVVAELRALRDMDDVRYALIAAHLLGGSRGA